MGWRRIRWNRDLCGRGDLGPLIFLFRARARVPRVLRKFAGMHRHHIAQMNSTGSQIAITGFFEVGKDLMQEKNTKMSMGLWYLALQ